MSRSPWRSLQTRIAALAVATCVFLAIALASLWSFLSTSHQAAVQRAERHLSYVATNLARTYSAQAAHGISLRDAPGPPRPPGPPPPPPDGAGPLPPPPHPPLDPLSQLTAGVLQKEEGIEGGFLAGDGPLVGYAFPTHEGPGAQKEMPQRERPTIDELAHKAARTGQPQSFVFEGSHDVVLFTAQPVTDAIAGRPQITGAVWLMQRLPDINRGRNQQLLFAGLGFGAAALLTALFAWFVTVEVGGDVNAITHRLTSLELDLSQPVDRTQRPQLAEFGRVLDGINAMAAALERRVTYERGLEDQLRHKERLSSLGQFAAGVAHELRNPLATIRLRAQMSESTSAGTNVARNSSVILEEVDRLDTMIGRLLYFARPISLDLERVDAGELCAAVVAAWAERVSDTFQLSCRAEGDTTVLADRSRLLQVLNNLVENAIQASDPLTGNVMLRASRQDQALRIDVIDQGTGFAPETIKRAFDPFFTTKETGTGLGLSIAFELMEAHGGQLQITSTPEQGTIVSITLPQKATRERIS